MIQETLDEYIFFRTYLRDPPFNVWVILRLLAKYGTEARKFCQDDKNKTTDQRKQDNYYRTVDIGYDEEKDDVKVEDNMEFDNIELPQYQVDNNGNLIRHNAYGDIIEIKYADPENPVIDVELGDSDSDENDEDIVVDEEIAQEDVLDIDDDDPLLYEQIRQYIHTR